MGEAARRRKANQGVKKIIVKQKKPRRVLGYAQALMTHLTQSKEPKVVKPKVVYDPHDDPSIPDDTVTFLIGGGTLTIGPKDKAIDEFADGLD